MDYALVTVEQIVEESEEGVQFLFPSLDLILAPVVPDPQALVSSLGNSKLLLKQDFTVSYVSVPEDHFHKIRALGDRPLSPSVHLIDKVLTVLCQSKRADSLSIGYPTCAEQLMQLIRVRLFRDNPTL